MARERCCICSKIAPRPVLVCTQCSDGLDTDGNIKTTYYCDTFCRAKDKKTHKQNCKDSKTRKQLYRAGDLLQAIFYKFREAGFDMKIKKVEKTSDRLVVFEDWYNEGDQEDGPLFRFPKDLLQDPKDKAKLLTMQSCTDACAYLFELSQSLLRGVGATIEETHFGKVVGDGLTCRIMPHGVPDTTNYGHSVLTVDATDGETYVVDFAGAQFEQWKAVVPFDTYIKSIAHNVSQVHPHGHSLDQFTRIRNGTFAQKDLFDFRATHIGHDLHQRLLAAVKEWEEDNKTDIRQLVRGRLDAYEKGKDALLSKIIEDMTAFVEGWEKGGRDLEPYPRLVLSDTPYGRNPEAELKCTVKPKGKGSRAFQQWQRDSQPPAPTAYDLEMRQFIEDFKAGGGTVFSTSGNPEIRRLCS